MTTTSSKLAALAIPEAAQARLRQLEAIESDARRNLFCFVEGLLLGMGLDPDEWELSTGTMSLHRQEAAGVNSNGTNEDKRGVLSSSG